MVAIATDTARSLRIIAKDKTNQITPASKPIFFTSQMLLQLA
jgi:hypothetical protein